MNQKMNYDARKRRNKERAFDLKIAYKQLTFSCIIGSVGILFMMGVLLLSDRRVLELRRARSEVQLLDRQIAERRAENESLRAAIDAANRHEFPAEKVAREELHLVQPDDVVLLYPPGTLTKPRATPIPEAQTAPPAR